MTFEEYQALDEPDKMSVRLEQMRAIAAVPGVEVISSEANTVPDESDMLRRTAIAARLVKAGRLSAGLAGAVAGATVAPILGGIEVVNEVARRTKLPPESVEDVLEALQEVTAEEETSARPAP